MKTIILYLYHMTCAAVLNAIATYHAHQMREGVPGSGQKLKEIGGLSNFHERARDDAGERVRSWLR